MLLKHVQVQCLHVLHLLGYVDCTFGKTDVLQNILSLGENNYLELLNKDDENITNEKAQFTTTIILRDETKNATLPPKAHGYILLDDDYEKLLAAKTDNQNITTVAVGMNVNSITRIDSKAMIVGLEISVTLVWEDDRIKWPKGKPEAGDSFLLDPVVLR